MFEGVPMYPDAGRLWEIVERHRVTQLYTAPTAIRALKKHGDSYVTKYDRSSLRILGTVGEPINPEAWLWYYNVVGEGRCSVVDTFWQTETGGIMVCPLPGATPTKPGSASLPFWGVEPVILDPVSGKLLEGAPDTPIVPSWLKFGGPKEMTYLVCLALPGRGPAWRAPSLATTRAISRRT